MCAAADAGDHAQAQAHYQLFARELVLVQFQMGRGMTAAAANMQEEQDYVQLQGQLEASIEAVRSAWGRGGRSQPQCWLAVFPRASGAHTQGVY